jgi:hypothetical protein
MVTHCRRPDAAARVVQKEFQWVSASPFARDAYPGHSSNFAKEEELDH